ncbi:MAG: zinc ribbon domain-containing protein [Acidobacteriota bacterium]
MAVYEFACGDCNKTFEVIQSIKNYDPKKVQCPHCGSKNVERLWSEVFAITSKKS